MTSQITEPPRAGDAVPFSPAPAPALAPESAAPNAGRDWWFFAGVVALAFGLYAWGLSGNGLGNTYYSAAVRGMAHSWHDFFFASFDPGGYISVDKPPLAVWIGALSVRAFGYSSWSLLLPSAVAGAASVGVLWATVRRWFGVGAATVAGLVLAFTPISASVNRLNLPEPFMILLLVAAAWAVLRALDSPRPYRWLVLGGAFVGLGFNTKMLAALIVTPALALAVVAGTKGWGPRVRRVLVLAGSSLAFCLPWMVTVDLWPSSGRPYVGGSTNNTVRDLVFGYNGIGRVDGQGQIGGGGAPASRPASGAPVVRMASAVLAGCSVVRRAGCECSPTRSAARSPGSSRPPRSAPPWRCGAGDGTGSAAPRSCCSRGGCSSTASSSATRRGSSTATTRASWHRRSPRWSASAAWPSCAHAIDGSPSSPPVASR